MNLRTYLNQMDEDELTCWDATIISEFYFYKEIEDDDYVNDYLNVDACMEYLKDHLEIKKIYPHGVVVDLYGLLDNPSIIAYAKDNLYTKKLYTDEEIVECLFDDMVTNIGEGLEIFSGKMMNCFNRL